MNAEQPIIRKASRNAVEPLLLNATIGQLNDLLLADFISFQLFMSHQIPW